MKTLPKAATDKLSAIVMAADDAQALVSSIIQRISNARKQLQSVSDPAVFADVEAEIAKLQEKRQEHDRRLADLTAIVGYVRNWLKTLGPGVVLELAKPVRITRGEDGSWSCTIDWLRGEIAAAQSELQQVRRAPQPKAALKSQVRDKVEAMARPPRLTIKDGGVKIEFHDANAMAAPSLERTAGLLAWFDPDKMVKLLQAEIDAMPEPPLAMSAEQKAARIAELTASLEQLERQEEAAIEAARAEGIDVLRRPKADPRAVLGVVERQKKAAAA